MTTAIYVGLVAVLLFMLARDVRRRPAGQSRIVTLKRPSPSSWVVMALAVAIIILLENGG